MRRKEGNGEGAGWVDGGREGALWGLIPAAGNDKFPSRAFIEAAKNTQAKSELDPMRILSLSKQS